MPVNIYKGELYHTSRPLESSNDLFNNPSLWSKLSVFNQRSEDDFSDLERFIKLVRLAETSNADFDDRGEQANFVFNDKFLYLLEFKKVISFSLAKFNGLKLCILRLPKVSRGLLLPMVFIISFKGKGPFFSKN